MGNLMHQLRALADNPAEGEAAAVRSGVLKRVHQMAPGPCPQNKKTPA
jgi:hypothetical protein